MTGKATCFNINETTIMTTTELNEPFVWEIWVAT